MPNIFFFHANEIEVHTDARRTSQSAIARGTLTYSYWMAARPKSFQESSCRVFGSSSSSSSSRGRGTVLGRIMSVMVAVGQVRGE